MVKIGELPSAGSEADWQINIEVANITSVEDIRTFNSREGFEVVSRRIEINDDTGSCSFNVKMNQFITADKIKSLEVGKKIRITNAAWLGTNPPRFPTRSLVTVQKGFNKTKILLDDEIQDNDFRETLE